MSINISRRKTLKCIATAVVCAPALTTTAAYASKSKPEIYTGRFSSVALQGYDPVSYFTGDAPVKGDKSYQVVYKNADWYFSSKANQNAFNNDPERYTPQFGGYCAFSVAQGKIVKGDATLWAMVNDKLYINFNKGIHRLWLKRPQTLIEKAHGQWPTILG